MRGRRRVCGLLAVAALVGAGALAGCASSGGVQSGSPGGGSSSGTIGSSSSAGAGIAGGPALICGPQPELVAQPAPIALPGQPPAVRGPFSEVGVRFADANAESGRLVEAHLDVVPASDDLDVAAEAGQDTADTWVRTTDPSRPLYLPAARLAALPHVQLPADWPPSASYAPNTTALEPAPPPKGSYALYVVYRTGCAPAAGASGSSYASVVELALLVP